jgi:hypothetical protein
MVTVSMKNALHSLWFVAVLGACQSSEQPAPTSETPQPLAAGPASSIGLVSATRLAFTPDGAAFRGGYLTHQVRVSDGIIDLVPKSLDANGTRVTGGPMTLETSGVTLGESLLGIGVAPPTAIAPNIVQINRGDLVERITNREDGIEQSWVFQAKPEGDGDLTVDVSVTGQNFVTDNERGLHFASPLGLGFAYSHAAWRDSNDQEWPIPVRYEGGRIRITVPEELLAKSTYPATLDPTITGELFTDNPAIGTTGFTSFQQDVASDGTQFLVVWADQRDDRNFDIFGARVTAGGAISDTSGIKIATGTATVGKPRVASVGNGFVVAWEQSAGAGNNDVVAAFVSTAGAVTQLGNVAATASNESEIGIAGQSGNALITWQSGTTSIMGAVYNGTTVGAPFAVVTGTGTEADPAVGSNGAGTYLVTYTETGSSTNIRGQLVTSAGALSGAAFDVAATTGAEVQSTVGFDGTNFIVAFQAATDIKGARVSPAGMLLDATAVVINSNVNAQTLPDISCAANSCLVAWDDLRNQATTGHDVFAAVIGTSGAITVTTNDIALATIARSQSAPHVALAGTTFLGVWDDNRNTDTIDVRGTRVSNAGAILDASNLVIVRNTSNFGAPTSGPTIAQSTSFTDVFFNDSQIPDENVVHVRFTSSGAQSDNPPKIVSNATADQIQPAGATVGGNSLVVWTDSRNFVNRNIFAARVNVSTGAVIDASGIQVSAGTGDQVVPKLASSGNSALVVWQDRRNANFDIFAAVIDSTGAVTTTDIPICVTANDQTRPAVAYDSVNNQYLVVWQDITGGTLDIFGARVSAAGALLDANCGVPISQAANGQFSADAACAAGQCLVVWEDRRNDAALGDIFGSRVTLGGATTVMDPAGIAIAVVAGSAQAAPTVAAASGYLVAWSDTRNSATTGTDIFGGQVGTNGIVSATFPISQDPEDETLPDLVPSASGSNPFSIAYLKKNVALDATRINVRRITLGSGSGQACTADAQCTTGFCRDYKCCNTDCGGGGANGNVNDCQACSLAHHGQADGTCTTIAANQFYICRLYADPFCDKSEVCDGVATTCPADSGQHQGLVCNAGTGAVCPPNAPPGPHRCP